MKKIAIIQSAYIPWKGLFDLLGRCDEYVIFDSVQYARRHWHNRNKIKTAAGLVWITIPVITGGKFDQPISDVKIEKSWADKHWRAIENAYSRAPYFEEIAPSLKQCYRDADSLDRLSVVNELFMRHMLDLLALPTRMTTDADYPCEGIKTQRLLTISRAAGATHYLSGPSAKDYFDEDMFTREGIATEWMDYRGYPEYPQLHGNFEHGVSIIDTLFNVGVEATRQMLENRR